MSEPALKSQNPVLIVGAGRHALEIFRYYEDAGRGAEVAGFLTEGRYYTGKEQLPLPVDTVENWLALPADKRSGDRLLVAIGSSERRHLIAVLEAAGARFDTLIHPTAYVGREVMIETGVQIGPGCILTTEIRVGAHSILNIGCSLSHDVTLGRMCTLSPGVRLAGKVTAGPGVFFGIGAVVIDKITIGEGSIIAAGACVTRDIPPGVMAAGVPATIRKQVTS
ncbi:MAG: acetyltransferase [Bacteroidetes bacterium]|nr:acetyltransferase [Bacteroidota bacterium]